MRAPFRGFSARLTAALVAIATIPVLVIGSLGLRKISQLTSDAAQRELQLSADAAAQAIVASVDRLSDQARAVVADSDVRRAVKSPLFLDRTDIRTAELVANNAICAAVFLVDLDGKVVTAAPDSALKDQPPLAVQQMLAAEPKDLSPSRIMPIQEGEWLSTLLSHTSPGIDRVPESPSSFAMILPVPGHMGRPGGFFVAIIPVERLAQTAEAHTPQAATLDIVKNGISTLNRKQFNNTDESLFVIETPLKSRQLGTDFGLVVSEPRARRFEGVRKITIELGLLITAIVALLAAVGYALATRLLKPLKSLSDQANSYAKGDYDRKRPELDYWEFDEVALTLENMAIYVKRHLAAERARLEAEMSALRGQMGPHFLFNTLNGLATMVRVDSENAVAMLGKLADLYRLTLESTKGPTSPLEHELEIARLYLELEAMRFGKRLSFDVANAFAPWTQCPLPGLILQTLVENAVKHGIAKSRAGGQVKVRLVPHENRLQIIVTNSGAPYRPNTGGVGLANTERRLTLMYGEDHQFKIACNNGDETEVSFYCRNTIRP